VAEFWLTRTNLITPRGIVDGAVKVAQGRIASVRRTAPKGAVGISLRGGYLAPGFIDLHIWGDPSTVAQEAVARGTTAFLTTVGPQPPEPLIEALKAHRMSSTDGGAECLGIHLEGPFLNPARAGALPRQWMRPPTIRELGALVEAAGSALKLITVAPELPGAIEAIRWCRRHGVVISLGHSEADDTVALRAVAAGAAVLAAASCGSVRTAARCR
jgi:N-acetylglucosamine-6-phosphate deacetylase